MTVDPIMSTNGVLPGFDWPDDIVGCDDDEGFITDWVYPFDEAPLLQAIVDQAHGQWRDLFPDADDRDRVMFLSGLVAAAHWWTWRSVSWRNQARAQAEEEGAPLDDHVFVDLDDVDMFVDLNTTRLASIVFAVPDRDDDGFAGIVGDYDA